MACAGTFIPDHQRALVEPLGVGVLCLAQISDTPAQLVEGRPLPDGLRQRLLLDRQRAPVKPLGVRVPPFVPVRDRQVVEGLSHMRMACASVFFVDRQRALSHSASAYLP